MIVQEQTNFSRGSMKRETHSTFGFIIFLVGVLLTLGGLCILIINLIRY